MGQFDAGDNISAMCNLGCRGLRKFDADLDSFQPITNVDERPLVSDVIKEQDAISSSEVRLGNAAKPAQVRYR